MFDEPKGRIEIAKLLDKIKYCKEKNKIVNTEFLDSYMQERLIKKLNELGYKNYLLFGGYEEATYKIIIIYPDKFEIPIVEKNIEDIVDVINIKLPNELLNKYKHRDYLSAIMKLGLERNRIGDILVKENGADIIVLKENSRYIKDSLKEFIRFRKSEIKISSIKSIEKCIPKFEDIKILVSSMRLDNIVAELIRASRKNANELIEEEKVYLNYSKESKPSRIVKVNDILTIRGKGKFKIVSEEDNKKKTKKIVSLKKYA